MGKTRGVIIRQAPARDAMLAAPDASTPQPKEK